MIILRMTDCYTLITKLPTNLGHVRPCLTYEGFGSLNRSLKENMCSAIPVALLCMVVNWSERKQDSGPEEDKVL